MSYRSQGDLQKWITTLEMIVDEMQDVDDSDLTVAIETVALAIEELEAVVE